MNDRGVGAESEAMYRRIVVPVHGEAWDQRAIDLAAAVARGTAGAEISLVYVVEVPQEFPLDADLADEIERGEAVLSDAEHYAKSRSGIDWRRVGTELLQARSAGAAIVDEAIEHAADAIVVAAVNRPRRGIESIGHTVPYILKNAPCNVVVLRLYGNGGEV